MMSSRMVRCFLASAVMGVTGAVGYGQALGLPLGDTANPMPAELCSAAAAVTLSRDYDFYGFRGAYAITDQCRVFGDLGAAEVDGGRTGPALEVGGL